MKRALLPLLLIFALACAQVKTEQEAKPEFQEQIIFPVQNDHVHGPTVVELPNGDILSAWFQGSGERWADDVQIMGARLSKGDTTWSEPFLMADYPGFPDINPMMFLDNQNRLWLMWYAVLANLWETSLPIYRLSENYENPGAPEWDWQEVILVKPGDKTERGIQPNDRFVLGAQKQLEEYEVYLKEEIYPNISEELKAKYIKGWAEYKSKIDSLAKGENMMRKGRAKQDGQSSALVLGYPLSRRIGWQTKNKPLIVGERLIVPFYSDGLDCSIFAISDDWGKNWQYSNPVLGGAGIQAAMAIKKDGTLVAYLRDNGPPPQRIQLTESKDNGLTWSIPKDTALPNSGSGFDMVTLASGEWVMVYNDSEEHRNNLVAAISDDDGQTWKWKRFLENDLREEEATRSHYPAVIQGKDGRIHAIYSYHHNDRKDKNKTIKYASFTVDWVKSGS
ncbi:sialidase family protein [Flexithrix dorotheae]|uniref:sialidase family protein n=1 Tax=Flexithrix dorotheae TaxID=70993 RepID=UPI0003695BC3|nr:sialidase family protein [Flexithrix dorotheae]